MKKNWENVLNFMFAFFTFSNSYWCTYVCATLRIRPHACIILCRSDAEVCVDNGRVWGRVVVAGGQGAGGQKKSKKKKEKRDENEYCGGGEGGTHGRLLQTS